MNQLLDRLKSIGPGMAANWIAVFAALIVVLGLMRWATPELYMILIGYIPGEVAAVVMRTP